MSRNPDRSPARSWPRRLRPLALALALLATAAPAPGAQPRRIVSLDMCADELVIALADPGQIAALTEWARDPRLSVYARRARAFPFTHRTAEEVMALRPDLVIGAPPRSRAALAGLGAHGPRMIDLPAGEGVAGIEAGITVVADAVGHPERGAAAIAAMRANLARIDARPGRGRSAAYYQRGGYLTGAGTLVDEAMRRVGLVNLARRLRRPALSALSVEELALARPDFLVMDPAMRVASDRGAAMLRSPVLARAVPAARILFLPQALTVCGTPEYPRAVALLAAQVRAADQRRTLTPP